MREVLDDGKEFRKEEVRLVDVGGSTGHDILALKKTHPNLTGRLVLQDLPATTESVDADVLAVDGIEHMAYDFFTPQPIQGAKAYHLKIILHDWPNANCKEIPLNLRNAMRPGYSRILLVETVIPDVGAGWYETSMDVLMMSIHAAHERREREWRGLIESVEGLKVRTIWDVEGAVEKVIEVERVEVAIENGF